MKRIGTALAAILAATLGIVAFPAPEAAAAPYTDPYTQEGQGIINGREWRTTCAEYSKTVTRCRAEIKATQVQFKGGRFVEVNDWVFNNLTYLPSPRTQWKGNPLAADGVIRGTKEWTTDDGRQWRVECDTATTGYGGCRAYIFSTIYRIKTMTPRTYEQANDWVFNNVVLFTPDKPTPPPPPAPCNAAPLPSGFALTKEGRPHAIKTPYSPNTLYNPTSISNFIRSVQRTYASIQDKNSQAAKDQKCLALLGAEHLMKGSETTQNAAGQTVRWFPYMFPFSANPTMDELVGPWHSGLAQGGVLTTFIVLADLTGDRNWLERGAETFRSFEVPVTEPGGILNRNHEDGFLWFEEYPTKPLPTTVLNGHLEAIIGLNLWHRRMAADGANAVTPPAEVKALVDEAMATLEPMLKVHEVDIDGGLLTSYDAVRGHAVAPLRIHSDTDTVTASATLNGRRVALPSTTGAWERDFYLANHEFDEASQDPTADQSMPANWTRFGSASHVVWRDRTHMDVTSNGNGWQGFQQSIPASWLRPVAGKPLTLTMRASVTYPSTRAGASGRVAMFNECPGEPRSFLYENVLRGSGRWTHYTCGFTAPEAGCGMLVQFMISPYQNAGTRVLVDDLHLSSAQPVGTALTPQYDLQVYKTPENELSLTGSGTGTVQAHYNGRWQDIQEVTLGNSATTVVIPERYTGRNLHLGYHEAHVGELMSLHNAFRPASTGTPHPYPFLLAYAQRWAPMAPSRHHTVPKDTTVTARSGISPMGVDTTVIDGDVFELPPLVDQFTGLPYDQLEMLDELEKPAS